MKRCKYIVWVLFSLMISCSDKKEHDGYIERQELDTAMERIFEREKYSWGIILPGLGCHGCIQEGEFFMKNNINREDILFVITNFSSLKILQQKIGIDKLTDKPNVYIDKNNLFLVSTQNKKYPCVIYLTQGKIVKHLYQSPMYPALHNLDMQLSKKSDNESL